MNFNIARLGLEDGLAEELSKSWGVYVAWIFIRLSRGFMKSSFGEKPPNFIFTLCTMVVIAPKTV